MRMIYKYVVGSVELPLDAIFLKSALHYGIPTFWYLVDPNNDSHLRNFITVGTGQPIPDNYFYIDTYFDDDYVWHIFEVAKND